MSAATQKLLVLIRVCTWMRNRSSAGRKSDSSRTRNQTNKNKSSRLKFTATHLHGALAQLDHLEQSDGVAAIAVVLSDAVGLASTPGDAHRLVCRRLAGLLVGRLLRQRGRGGRKQDKKRLKKTKRRRQQLAQTRRCQKNPVALTRACFPGRPLFFLPLISVSSISLMFMLKPTASVAPDSLDESLGDT